MKKVLSGFVVLMLLVLMCLPAIATADGTPPLSDISPDPDFWAGSWTSTQKSSGFAFSYLYFGISKVSSTSVRITATTQTNQTADQVGGVMYLQKWVNNAWTNVRSRGFYAYNDNECSDTTTWTVDSGYYYRLRTIHSADLDATLLTKVSYTNSILVN